ncbi:MAG: segregation/condensation protein A [Desulfuromonadales bacterium]|nr:segregation/condensation protein A [Desulfuromonadales bacterium]
MNAGMENYAIQLENFEGPLDLLLHLIKKNEMDIYDIPMAAITDQYLTILDAMKILNLDLAGEFLLMAATLLHIKSKLLLPKMVEEEPEEEEEDPRAELVRRLLEYQKYKEVSQTLERQPRLGRDLFARAAPQPEVLEDTEAGFVAVGLYDLLAALRDVLKESPEQLVHEVNMEQLSVKDRINVILSSLQGQESIAFVDLFSGGIKRNELIVTFLALLELVKLRMVRFMQNTSHGTIWLFPAVVLDETGDLDIIEDTLGYT